MIAVVQLKPLTPMMLSLIAFMRKFGDKVHRHPGGFWTNEIWSGRITYGTSSVQALVDRGLAAYTRSRTGANGTFPIEATLTAAAAVVEGSPS